MRRRKSDSPVRTEPLAREALTPGEERFVENMGLYFEKNGIARIGGRSLGLLMISEGPVSLDQMAELLRVSRASISTNMRQFIATGLCEHFSIPGDRRHFYVFSESAWSTHMRNSLAGLRVLGELVSAGLSSLPSGRPRSRERLRQSARLFSFFEKEMASILDRWESK